MTRSFSQSLVLFVEKKIERDEGRSIPSGTDLKSRRPALQGFPDGKGYEPGEPLGSPSTGRAGAQLNFNQLPSMFFVSREFQRGGEMGISETPGVPNLFRQRK